MRTIFASAILLFLGLTRGRIAGGSLPPEDKPTIFISQIHSFSGIPILTVKHTSTFAIAAVCACAALVPTQAATTFTKSPTELVVESTDIPGPAWFLFEKHNKKYRVEMCDGRHGYYHSGYVHVKCPFDSFTTSTSFAILSGSTITKFPMPTYRPKAQWNYSHCTALPVEYNEFTCRNASQDDIVLEISYTDFNGQATKNVYRGREDVAKFYRSLGPLITATPVDPAPSFVNVFSEGNLLVTKADLVQLQTDVGKICKEYGRKAAVKASNAAPDPSGPQQADGKGISAMERVQRNLERQSGGSSPDGKEGRAIVKIPAAGAPFSIRCGDSIFRTQWGPIRSSYPSTAPLSITVAKGGGKLLGGAENFAKFPPSQDDLDILDFSQETRTLKEGQVVLFVNNEEKFLAVKLVEIASTARGAGENSIKIRWKLLDFE